MKRLVLSFLLALAVHAVLFQAELPLARPVLPSPQKRSVSINLVAVQKRIPQPAPSLPDKPKPKSQSVKLPVPKASARVKPYKPTLKTMVAIKPLTPLDPAPEAFFQERQSFPEADAAAIEEAPAAAAPGRVSDSAGVIVSVPRYDLNPPLEYPQRAVRRHWEGTVVLGILVDEHGAVAEISVARSSGHALLDRNALSQVKSWRFAPARRGGRAIAMWVKVPVHYQLR